MSLGRGGPGAILNSGESTGDLACLGYPTSRHDSNNSYWSF